MSSTVNRAPDPRPARTKAAIYAAARELSAADGDVTVNALAKRAGVSRAAFYSHFGGLDDLMGDLIGELIERNAQRSAQLTDSGMSEHHSVQVSVADTAAFVAERQAFLRGALAWHISHHTYLIMVRIFAGVHEETFDRLGDAVPGHLPRREMARFLSGGMLDVIIQWLLDADRAVEEGRTLDPAVLTERLLLTLPAWYTGLEPGRPIPPEILAATSSPQNPTVRSD